MGRLPESVIEEIRAKTDLLALVSEHVTMRPSGAAHKGLCPFHDEKTPSFTVNPSTGTFHCFGCGMGGDAFTFLLEIEGGLSFPEVVRMLGERCGVEIPEADEEEKEQNPRSRLYAVNEAAALFFAGLLRDSPEAEAARQLLRNRGFDLEASIARFGCGYAPTKSDALSKHLRQKGFTVEEIVGAGLASMSKESRRTFDRFRGRLVWTIRNPFGKAIGFGARKLSDNDPIEAKFINTAETAIYKKSHVLYGLDRARKVIAKSEQVVVVEGYADVMAMHLAGIENAVACCGTAFGREHLSTVLRMVGESGEIIAAFDDDAAGIKAAMKFYDAARGSVRRLSALPSSGDKDPDAYRQAHGDAALRDLVGARRPLIETVIHATLSRMPLETAEDRRVALEAVLPLLKHVTDRLIQASYVEDVASRLNFSVADVARSLSSSIEHDGPPPEPEDLASRTPSSIRWLEGELLRVFVQDHAAAKEHLAIARWNFNLPQSEMVSDVIERALDTFTGQDWHLHVRSCATDPKVLAMIGALGSEPVPVEPEQLEKYALELQERLLAEAQKEAMRRRQEDITNARTPEDRARAFKAFLEASRGNF